MTAPAAVPRPGELWAGPAGDEWLVLDRDGTPWLARPAADIDLTGWHLAAAAEPQAVIVEGPAAYDSVLTATCPHCHTAGFIAEVDENAALSRLDFYRGTDNDQVYGTAPSSDPNVPVTGYLCVACRQPVRVPLDIELVA